MADMVMQYETNVDAAQEDQAVDENKITKGMFAVSLCWRFPDPIHA